MLCPTRHGAVKYGGVQTFPAGRGKSGGPAGRGLIYPIPHYCAVCSNRRIQQTTIPTSAAGARLSSWSSQPYRTHRAGTVHATERRVLSKYSRDRWSYKGCDRGPAWPVRFVAFRPFLLLRGPVPRRGRLSDQHIGQP